MPELACRFWAAWARSLREAWGARGPKSAADPPSDMMVSDDATLLVSGPGSLETRVKISVAIVENH